MKIEFAAPAVPRIGAAATFVFEKGKLSPSAERLNTASGGVIARAIKGGRFSGKAGQTLVIEAPGGLRLSRIMLVGLGAPKGVSPRTVRAAGGQIAGNLANSGDKLVAVMVDAIRGSGMAEADIAADLGYGAQLGSYRFDRYHTKGKPEDKPSLNTVRVLTKDPNVSRQRYGTRAKVAEGVFLTRDLITEPANVLYPATLAARARKLAKLGVKVEVLDRTQMKKLGMGALLGVAQGSARSPRLVIMRWNGAPKARNKAPIAIVGKGVTFDSGGISIKPSAGMEDMKWDMGGAGVTIGLMQALAGRKAKVNVVGVVGLVENMPSSTAQRPGDVVTSMSGQTIEVINTDAEGRLVLADALWYCQQKFKPHTVVDLATLTGAIIVSLGNERAGLFANDDQLSKQLMDAGDAVDEPLWRFPLGDVYDRQINSDIADMKNVGQGRGAGSITAAQFLQRFIQKDVKWAHLDIAGVTWSKESSPITPKGGTGFGVRLLDRLIAEHYENK